MFSRTKIKGILTELFQGKGAKYLGIFYWAKNFKRTPKLPKPCYNYQNILFEIQGVSAPDDSLLGKPMTKMLTNLNFFATHFVQFASVSLFRPLPTSSFKGLQLLGPLPGQIPIHFERAVKYSSHRT